MAEFLRLRERPFSSFVRELESTQAAIVHYRRAITARSGFTRRRIGYRKHNYAAVTRSWPCDMPKQGSRR